MTADLFMLALSCLNILAWLYILQPHVRRDFARWLTPAKRRDNRVITLPFLDAYAQNVERQIKWRMPPLRDPPDVYSNHIDLGQTIKLPPDVVRDIMDGRKPPRRTES